MGGGFATRWSASIPALPAEAYERALRRLTRPEGATLESRNRAFHGMLVDGVTVEYRDAGRTRWTPIRAVDFDDRKNNDWLAVNQFTVIEDHKRRRPDIVLFVNGIPVGIVELKNPNCPEAIQEAWQQLRTYRDDLPTLFSTNELLIVSDGIHARVGTLSSEMEWFKPWRDIRKEAPAGPQVQDLRAMLEGVCAPDRLLALIQDFIVFEDDGGVITKKMAGYHQFHAVQAAVSETLRASSLRQAGTDSGGRESDDRAGDRRIGVVWHTQGSGKSLTMAFYAGRVVREPEMGNPTIVVLTDRNDLDDQLFGTFSRCRDLLRQPPSHAESRADLRDKLSVESGGVVFTTIQKFFPGERGGAYPVLSRRRNIVVIADEAHRSQYDFIDGFARHMRGRVAARLLCGVHRNAHRAAGRQHQGRLWRLYQRLRHTALRRGRRHRSNLLRKPPRQTGAGQGGAAAHRSQVRGDHRARGDGAQGEAQDPVGPAGGGGGLREEAEADRRGHNHAL